MEKIYGYIDLEDAIIQCKRAALSVQNDPAKHSQLGKWLQELQESRKAIAETVAFLNILQIKGGLGLDIHDQIDKIVSKLNNIA